MFKSSPWVPSNVILFATQILVGVIKLRQSHAGLGWSLIQWLVSLLQKQNLGPDREKATWQQMLGRERLEWCVYKPKNTKYCWQLPELGKRHVMEPPEGTKPAILLKGNLIFQKDQVFDQASRTMKE